MKYKLLHGDCSIKMKEMDDNSVEAIITDPPYGLSFMGKKWDYEVPSVEIWREALRVLKPGGHLLSFAGSRTYHRMAVNIEDAGFCIRDQIMWVYSTGFPKSHNIGQKAEEWVGWGSALKPAHEPIVVARKPLIGTIVENVLKHGTGGLNIDGCRVPHSGKEGAWGEGKSKGSIYNVGEGKRHDAGRFPANFIHDGSDEVVGLFPNENARFFYCAKTSQQERNAGLEHLADVERIDYGGFHSEEGLINNGRNPANRIPMKNPHPTVKPVDLMKYLCRLITPPNGIVLDPFMGSGTTGIAATQEGFNFIGIEMNDEYIQIANHRISHWVEEKQELIIEQRKQKTLFDGW